MDMRVLDVPRHAVEADGSERGKYEPAAFPADWACPPGAAVDYSHTEFELPAAYLDVLHAAIVRKRDIRVYR